MGVKPDWTLKVWRQVGRLIGPLVRQHIERRMRRGKEDPLRFRERFGFATRERPDGRLLWVHAASVGEFNSVLPLISLIVGERKAWSVLITTGTVTSARLAAGHLPPRTLHQFLPVDLPAPVRRFLDHWRPDAALFVESEFWPGLLGSLAERGIPIGLVNGRIEPKTAAKWQWARPIIAAMLGRFRVMLGQTAGDSARLERLGAPHVITIGNLKHAALPLKVDQAEHARLSALLAGRACWVAASTHEGEETIVLDVHRLIVEFRPDLLTIIVPRHPERGPAIATALQDHGVVIGLRSRGDNPLSTTGIYIADTMGEMGLWYRLAELAFMGGSLIPHGGQNMLEPARLGRAVLFGPNVWNFSEIVKEFLSVGAAREVKDGDELARAVRDLMVDHPDKCRAMGHAGRDHTEATLVTLDRFATALAPLFDDPGTDAAP